MIVSIALNFLLMSPSSVRGQGYLTNANNFALRLQGEEPSGDIESVPEEEGVGSGLRVTFDSWDNAEDFDPAIEIVVDSELIAAVSMGERCGEDDG